MTEDDALRSRQGSTWQLLLQFAPPAGPDSKRESVQRIMEAVGELGLQPAMAKRMEEAVMAALRSETQRGQRDQYHAAVSIRVLVSGLSTADPIRPGSVEPRAHSQEGGGWGFFLLERQADKPPATQIDSPRIIDLCLYQERARAKRE